MRFCRNQCVWKWKLLRSVWLGKYFCCRYLQYCTMCPHLNQTRTMALLPRLLFTRHFATSNVPNIPHSTNCNGTKRRLSSTKRPNTWFPWLKRGFSSSRRDQDKQPKTSQATSTAFKGAFVCRDSRNSKWMDQAATIHTAHCEPADNTSPQPLVAGYTDYLLNNAGSCNTENRQGLPNKLCCNLAIWPAHSD